MRKTHPPKGNNIMAGAMKCCERSEHLHFAFYILMFTLIRGRVAASSDKIPTIAPPAFLMHTVFECIYMY